MKIIKITLHNFKGIKSFSFDTKGNDTNIYGDNATGKTTLADAFMWLLFDKDSQNKKDFEIKTLGADGEPEHGLDHSVEAVLQLEDGRSLTLKKVYSEKWTKKRGSATAEFTGHTTDHYIDSVPVKKSEYDDQIKAIADEQIFRLLTDPTYFNIHLHWQKRRELLLEVCGDVSPHEVIASEPKLKKLEEILGNRTIDQHRKIITARRAEINRELERIPVRIDEVTRGLPDISTINEKALPDDIAKARAELQRKREELVHVKNGGQAIEKINQRRELEGQMIELKNNHREKLDELVKGKREEHQNLLEKISGLEIDIKLKARTAEYSEIEIKSIDEKLKSLRDKWCAENARSFEFEQNETCPACGQYLPQDQLQEARDKALSQFNKNKSDKLEAINNEGKILKQTQSSLPDKLKSLLDEIETTKADLIELEKKDTTLKAEIDAIMKGAQPVEETPEYKVLIQRNETLQDEIRKLQADNSLAVTEVIKDIDTLQSALEALERSSAKVETHKDNLKRIEQLKDEERKLAAEFEDLEQQMFLTEEFIRTKVRLLEDRINNQFKYVRFKLFNTLINGGVEECCETMYDGVPYSSLNNGARLNIGLDIINTLTEHYKFAPPVWLDNAESVTDIQPTKGQQIRLIVSKKDKQLRIEISKKEELKEAI